MSPLTIPPITSLPPADIACRTRCDCQSLPSLSEVTSFLPSRSKLCQKQYCGGLHTPPEEDMSSTLYHGPAAETCGPSTYLADSRRPRLPSTDYFKYHRASRALTAPESASHSQQRPPYHAHTDVSQITVTPAHALTVPMPQTTASNVPPSAAPVHWSSSSNSQQPSSRHSTRPSTPNTAYSDTRSTRGSVSMSVLGLQIPKRICNRGGSLSDFAAQATCFVWFGSFDVLRAAEQGIEAHRYIPPLNKLALPVSAYKKWVQSIISTTQVSQNVVILALLFIHRLKHTSLKVLPKPGSEYRLLTVALMLGNKFLDDNTYTNKTWAEVSGMTVQEIHVMEVEFLSNMRYNLYTTAEHWDKWLDSLKNVYDYIERAQPHQPSPISIPSPHRSFHQSPIPSPTGSTCSGMYPSTTPNSRQGSLAPNWSFSGGSPLSNRPTLDAIRKKRSFEGDPTETPAKRIARPQPHAPSSGHRSGMSPAPRTAALSMFTSLAATHEPVRLPAPSLSINTQLAPLTSSHHIPTSASQSTQPAISLPPLTQGVRAMSTVYATTTAPSGPGASVYSHQGPAATTGSCTASLAVYSSGYHTPTITRHSPNSAVHLTYGSSSQTETFSSGVHTPISQSPSMYLQQRPSPYRPIRHVNTLLYPPPSSSLNEYHLTPSQMHYQPLGRRDDVRTGIVPEYRAYRNPQAAPASLPSTRGPLPHTSLS